MAPWCSGYNYCTASFNKAWTQVLRRFKPCWRRVGDSRWWGSLTMVPAGNKAKHLSLVNHTTKTIHHHSSSAFFKRPLLPVAYCNNVLSILSYIFLCDALHNLVPFVQVKKSKKQPWMSVTFNKVSGWSIVELRRNFLLVTRYSLLVTRCFLLVTRYFLLATCYSLLFTRYSLLSTDYSLLFTRYSLLLTRHLFLFTRYSLLLTCCLLLLTRYSLRFIYTVLHYIHSFHIKLYVSSWKRKYKH